jgi:hypothetical protein
MVMTEQEVTAKRQSAADELTAALKQQFNLQSLKAYSGLLSAEPANPEFIFRILDKNTPDTLVGDDVLNFAKEKIQALLPNYKSTILAGQAARACGME